MASAITRIDWSFAEVPPPATSTASGLARTVLIGRAQGAVHTDIAIATLHAGGWFAPHVHSYEESLYLLEGELLVLIGDRVHRLVRGDYTLFPVGVRHGLGNSSGTPARWMSVNSPQKLDPDGPRRDTFFETPLELAAMEAAAERPPFGDPTLRYVGHYDGTPPQAEALAVRDAARGRAPAGMDSAILAYSGISVKMLVDRVFGADHLTVFTVDYEPGGAAQAHDHPFEEAYVFLDGEIEGELDGEHVVLRAGDVMFAGVGAVHGFYNTGSERVRWIETQAPQPPARHAYRWAATWERYEQSRGR
jgi:quercetin dioxygenase-like cupin family protein